MPESTHRRKGKRRPRPSRSEPPQPNPEPSPTWIPATGVTLLSLGVLVIFLGYLRPVQTLTEGLPIFGANWNLIGGFLLLAGGFGFLTRWQ